MKTAVAILGAFVLVGALIGFFRSLWRAPTGEGNHGYGALPGETASGTDTSADGGGTSVDGGGGHG